MDDNSLILTITGALGGLGAYLCGLNWEIIIIWLLLMTLDIIMGVLKAGRNNDFCSRDMKIGLYQKAGDFILLFALILGQRVAILNGINVPVGSIFTGAFCFKELGSIIENALDMDINIPSIIQKWFRETNKNFNGDVEHETK